MLVKIYALPISTMVWWALAGITLWVVAGLFVKKYWRPVNVFLLVLGLTGILYITLFKRTTGEYDISLVPFVSFRLARINPEYYRTMLLNCLMFVPFGLGLSVSIPWKISSKMRAVIMILTGTVVSFSIELIQYLFKLGNAEVDDIIFNVLGMVLAAVAFAIWQWGINYEKHKSNKRDN